MRYATLYILYINRTLCNVFDSLTHKLISTVIDKLPHGERPYTANCAVFNTLSLAVKGAHHTVVCCVHSPDVYIHISDASNLVANKLCVGMCGDILEGFAM